MHIPQDKVNFSVQVTSSRPITINPVIEIYISVNMSSSQKNTNNAVLNTSSPQHRLHDSSRVLPGSGSYAAVQTQDYSPTNIECISSCVIHGKDTSAQSDDANFTRAALEPTPSAGRTRPASERERSW
jgi:hypothetical protein